MSTTKTWPGGSTNVTPTAYSIPAAGEINWAALSSFLNALGDSAQATTFQKFAVRKATTSPVTASSSTDCIISTDLAIAGAVAVTLPVGQNKLIYIVSDGKGDAKTNNITITPNGSETIAGSATMVLNTNRESVMLVYNSGDTDWKIAGQWIPNPTGTDIGGFTASRGIVSDGSGNLAAATTTAAEIGYVNGVTSAIQTQLDTKAIGVGSAVDSEIALFDSTGGKQLKRSTGTGVAHVTSGVLSASNVVLTSEVTGTLPVANGGTGVTASTGSVAVVLSTSPTLVTPTIGVATATSINKVAITAPASSATLTIADGKTFTASNSLTLAGTDGNTMTFPSGSSTVMTLASADTITGVKTFGAAGNVGKLVVAGTTSGTTILNATATASGTLTLPATTDTLVGKATTDILTNKTLSGNTAATLISGSGTLTLNTSGTITVPNGTDTLVGKTTTDVLTNKTATAMDVTSGSYLNMLGQAATRYNDDSGGEYVAIKAPTGVTTYTVLLPAAQGAASTSLTNDGSGNLSWSAAASATLNQYNTDIGNASNVRTATNTNLLGDTLAKTSSSTITVTIATPGVVTWTSHGATSGEKVYFTNSGGALPTGITASTTYWVTVVDANSFKLSSSLSNYFLATFVTTSGSQSGTHTGFLGGLQDVRVQTANITGPDSAKTLVVTDAKTQIVVPTANRVYTLPTTGILAGDIWTIMNNSAVSSSDLRITVNSSGANLIRTIWSQTSASFMALVNTPTTAAHWTCLTPASSCWTAYTPTLSGVTNSVSGAFYRRVGQSMELSLYFQITGSASSTFTVSMPSTYTIDIAAQGSANTGGTTGDLRGHARSLVAGSTYYIADVVYNSTTTIKFLGISNGDFWRNAIPGTWANGDQLAVQFTAPIVGWTATGG